ncbi:hypothetical protein ACS0TY_024881 [Phlomoides rotata]
MALVTGGRSTLNPNAPLFIPAAMRQVEDFSPEWWDLVTTSTWFRDYWVSQHPGEDIFGEVEDGFNGNNVVQLLPDNIDLDVDEDILNMESQFEEFLQSSEAEFGFAGRGFDHVDARLMSPGVSPRDPMMSYWEAGAKQVSPRYSPRFIQQPF